MEHLSIAELSSCAGHLTVLGLSGEERGSLCHCAVTLMLSSCFPWMFIWCFCSLYVISGYFRKLLAPLVTLANRVTLETSREMISHTEAVVCHVQQDHPAKRPHVSGDPVSQEATTGIAVAGPG